MEERGNIDAETAEKWRAELDTALQMEHQSRLKAQELEQELQRQAEVVASLTSQLQELKDAMVQSQREVELETQRELQKLHQSETANVKISAEAEHWKAVSQQQEEEVSVLHVHVESMRQENQTLDARCQAKLKRMEQQVQHEMEQLQGESEKVRAEYARLLTDREKAHFDKERLALENKSIKQERTRLQVEMERMMEERQQMAGNAERLRLLNAKLTAACEEQTKSLEKCKVDQEAALNSIHQLESELHQWRKQETEDILTIQTLESRLEHAETEARRVQQQCELCESRCQQELNERLVALEKDRQGMKEDNRRLRMELSGLEVALEAMGQKVLDSEERFSNEAAKAANAPKTLFQASSELKTLKRSQKKLREESDRENYDIKESNRLLSEEVHERRRSTEHARKQYMKAVKENKELLKAIKIYKDAIGERDKDIKKYKATVVKYGQQLKRRVEFGDAKQTLLEQLEQTQYMIDETYKRWKTSSLVCGPESTSRDKDASYSRLICS